MPSVGGSSSAQGAEPGRVVGAVQLRDDDTNQSVSLGAGTATQALRVVQASDGAVLGAVDETAPASDTASSGLNGRLQRIAQRITSLFAFFGTTADAKSTATDTTAITAMQVWKQISASVQAIATSVAATLSVSFGASATGGYSYLNIAAGQATTVVKASAGTLHSIILNSAATATNTTIVYDHASGAGTVIGRPAVVTATVPTTLIYDIAFATGLTIITANANGGDMTVCYK